MRKDNLVELALGFEPDLAATIEGNRRRSRVYVEDFAIEGAAEDGAKMRGQNARLFLRRP